MGIDDIGNVRETTDVELYIPKTGEPLYNADGTKMVITIHGPFSPKYKKIRFEKQNKRLNMARRSGGMADVTAESIEDELLETMVKCIDGWNITIGSEPEEFSEQRAFDLFTRKPWVRDQIEKVFGDEKSFLD